MTETNNEAVESAAPVTDTVEYEATKGDKRLYELMVLFDPADAAKDWDMLVDSFNERMTKFGGEVVRVDKWDDNRKLAYEVKGLRRGTFMEAYFYLTPNQVKPLERNMQLDERIIRHMVLCHELVPAQMTLPPEERTKPAKETREPRGRERRGRRDR